MHEVWIGASFSSCFILPLLVVIIYLHRLLHTMRLSTPPFSAILSSSLVLLLRCYYSHTGSRAFDLARHCGSKLTQHKPPLIIPIHAIAVHSIAVLFVLSSLELKGRPLYLTGESYAGVYVPTLAKALLESQTVGTKRVR